MDKEKLIKVYQHTKGMCSDFPMPLSLKHSERIIIEPNFKQKGIINVEPLDTVSALIKYGNQNSESKTAVLNNASSKRKGGGVENGSIAQEECLFRCSNLFMIPDVYYPISSNEFIYTHQATFVKDSYYNTIFPIDADVITMPAVNLNKNHIDNKETKDLVENYEELMIFKIQQMFASAYSNDCNNIILGAWGCGVFKNDPKVVSDLFNKVLAEPEYRYGFDNIVFAIINDKNSVANNYEIFLETIIK
jgi:uncharacterized protein (TIGR02452 family)